MSSCNREQSIDLNGKFSQLIGERHSASAGWELEHTSRTDSRQVTVDGAPVRLYANFLDAMRNERPHTVRFRRGSQILSQTVRLPAVVFDTGGEAVERHYVRNWIAPPAVENPHRITYAMRQAIHRTTEVVEVTVPPKAVSTGADGSALGGVEFCPSGTPSASVSQLHATSGSIGSVAKSASMSTWI